MNEFGGPGASSSYFKIYVGMRPLPDIAIVTNISSRTLTSRPGYIFWYFRNCFVHLIRVLVKVYPLKTLKTKGEVNKQNYVCISV